LVSSLSWEIGQSGRSSVVSVEIFGMSEVILLL
jgi:hypothetical protein